MEYRLELTFQSNKKIIEMNKETECKILEISGIESSSYTIQKVESNQDGMIVSSKKIEPREIVIHGDIQKNENEMINRDRLIKFFHPKYSGELIINRNGNKKKIRI